ncbi:MAG: DUF1294 domain-containing protein [Acutalibacteraceae bacterium]
MEAFDFFKAVGIITAFFSVLAVVLTVTDKLCAKRHKRRIPEKTLILVGILGGAALEYITMKIIHHKTLHKKFMVGLPLIFLLQLAAFSAVYFFFFR